MTYLNPSFPNSQILGKASDKNCWLPPSLGDSNNTFPNSQILGKASDKNCWLPPSLGDSDNTFPNSEILGKASDKNCWLPPSLGSMFENLSNLISGSDNMNQGPMCGPNPMWYQNPGSHLKA